jgi:hypothetical protein
MTLTINVNGLTLCHRGSDGVSRNTLPDVCKTPPYAIPRPFSNTAYSKDLANGTTTVFADGGNMIGNFGSIFARSTGDEGGSMGGVKSGTFMAEADFIGHSFDVFFEGKAACRLTDKMYMNHRNTVNMAGLWQLQLPESLVHKICEAICECNSVKNTVTPSGAELAEVAESAFDAVRGVTDTTTEKASATKDIHRRQECFNGQFADLNGGRSWYGNTPKDPGVLVEVPMKGTDTLFSGTGRATYPGGPAAPMSPLRAISSVRGNPGVLVIWDMVTVKNKALPATWNNIDKIVEVKFAGDKWTPNQAEATKNPAISKKLLRVDEADCYCDLDENARRRETNELIRKVGDSMKKAAGLFLPGGSGGVVLP